MYGMNNEGDAGLMTFGSLSGDTITEDINFSDVQNDLTIQLTSMRRNADNMSSQKDHTGTWRWPGATLLGQFLYRHRGVLLPNKRIIELGCGPGLLSVVCSKSGCKHIVATDASSTCVELARYNLLQAISNEQCPRNDAGCSISACQLKWGPEQDLGKLLETLLGISKGKESHQMGGRGIEYSTQSLPLPSALRFDLSIGTELLYLRKGREEDGWSIFDQGKYLFALNKAILKHQSCNCNHKVWCSQPRTSKSLEEVMAEDCDGMNNGIFLSVYSPRYHGMAHALHDAAKASGVFLVSLHRSNCLTQELRKTKMYTDSRFIAVSTCARTLHKLINITESGLAFADPWDDSDTEAEDDDSEAFVFPNYFE